MSLAPPSAALDALASPGLIRRFPHLGPAMEADLMAIRLQRALLEGTGLVVDACSAPKVHIAGDECRLQYRLRVESRPGASARVQGEILVLGTMFADPWRAAAFERVWLAPIAARCTLAPAVKRRMTGVVEDLGMALSVYPVDARYPTLVELADAERMTHVLGRLISNGGSPAPVAAVDLVRYNRTHGSVLRYRIGHNGDSTVYYGKVGSASAAGDVKRGLEALGASGIAAGRGRVVFPRLLGHSAELDLMLFSEVPGARIGFGDRDGVGGMLEAAALAAASLHRCEGIGGRDPRTLDDELDRAQAGVASIRDDAPALAGWLQAILDRVSAWARHSAPQALALSHGDFTPSQLMAAGSRTVVLDLDGLCRAEPAFDLGRYLAYLRAALLKSDHGAGQAGDGLAPGLLARYHAAGGPQTRGERLALYELVSLVLMAVHGWQRIKPARVGIVCRLLEQRLTAAGGWATPTPWLDSAAWSRG